MSDHDRQRDGGGLAVLLVVVLLLVILMCGGGVAWILLRQQPIYIPISALPAIETPALSAPESPKPTQ